MDEKKMAQQEPLTMSKDLINDPIDNRRNRRIIEAEIRKAKGRVALLDFRKKQLEKRINDSIIANGETNTACQEMAAPKESIADTY